MEIGEGDDDVMSMIYDMQNISLKNPEKNYFEIEVCLEYNLVDFRPYLCDDVLFSEGYPETGMVLNKMKSIIKGIIYKLLEAKCFSIIHHAFISLTPACCNLYIVLETEIKSVDTIDDFLTGTAMTKNNSNDIMWRYYDFGYGNILPFRVDVYSVTPFWVD